MKRELSRADLKSGLKDYVSHNFRTMGLIDTATFSTRGRPVNHSSGYQEGARIYQFWLARVVSQQCLKSSYGVAIAPLSRQLLAVVESSITKSRSSESE